MKNNKVTALNGYNLTRNWYDFRFENPDITRPSHSDLYFYIVDLWNRLGHKENFGLPTAVTMECLNIGSYNTYKKNLNDLIDFGFITLVEESKNQHKSKVIALSNFDKATAKAFDKATAKALDKAHIKAIDKAIDKPTDDIDKQYNKQQKNKEQRTNTTNVVVDLKNQPNHSKIDFIELVSFFNTNRGILPEVKKLSEPRKKRILSLEKQYGKKCIQIAIEKTRDSHFLQGNNKEGWTANFDWIFKPANFLKILEDNYANKQNPRSSNATRTDADHKQSAVDAVNAMFGVPKPGKKAYQFDVDRVIETYNGNI